MLNIPVIGMVAGLLSKEVMGAKRSEFKNHPDHLLCSPINYVNKDFPKEIFLTYSKKDVFCKGQSEDLIKRLDGFGIDHEEHFATKLLDNHCYPLNWVGDAVEKNNELLEEFIRGFVSGETKKKPKKKKLCFKKRSSNQL